MEIKEYTRVNTALPTWRGNYDKGAMKAYREEKRANAEARNAETDPTRRRRHARSEGYSRHSDTIKSYSPAPATRRQRARNK